MLSPDTPISSSQNDQLNRSRFARKLGETLYRWEREDSIVVGLYGPWGSGKTSLVNMTLEHVEELGSHNLEHTPIIVKFNPWYFSDTNAD